MNNISSNAYYSNDVTKFSKPLGIPSMNKPLGQSSNNQLSEKKFGKIVNDVHYDSDPNINISF